MTDLRTMTQYVQERLGAGEVPTEYIGEHGVGGFLYPPLEFYDAHHDWLVLQPRMIELKNHWRDRYMQDEDEGNNEVESEEEGEMNHLIPADTKGGLFGPSGRDGSPDDDDEDNDDDDGDDEDDGDNEDEEDAEDDDSGGDSPPPPPRPPVLPASQVEPLDDEGIVINLDDDDQLATLANSAAQVQAQVAEQEAVIVQELRKTPCGPRPPFMNHLPATDSWPHEMSQNSVTRQWGDYVIDDVHGLGRFSHVDPASNDVLMNNSEVYDLPSRPNEASSIPFAIMMTGGLPPVVQSHWGSSYIVLSKQATGPPSIIDPMSLVVITTKDGTFVSAAILMMRSCPLRVAKDSQTILSQQPTFQMIKIKRCGRRHHSRAGWS